MLDVNSIKYPYSKGNFGVLGTGHEIGGKANSLFFQKRLLDDPALKISNEKVKIQYPRTLFIPVDIFYKFMEKTGLSETISGLNSNQEIREKFIEACENLDQELLSYFAQANKYFKGKGPLAVRSSHLLEDSSKNPFPGIFETNFNKNIGSDEQRLKQLIKSIAGVYASSFYKEAKAYKEKMNLGGENGMAVILSEVAGTKQNGIWAPLLSAVVYSKNLRRPIPPLTKDDGIAILGVGLGEIAVEIEKAYSFSPNKPKNYPWLDPRDQFLIKQNYIYAIDVENKYPKIKEDPFTKLKKIPIEYFLQGHPAFSLLSERVLAPWSRQGFTYKYTFSKVLKYDYNGFYLPDFLYNFSKKAEQNFGAMSDSEWAFDVKQGVLYIYPLQTRPIQSSNGKIIDMPTISESRVLFRSNDSLGNSQGTADFIIVVKSKRLNPNLSTNIRNQISELNKIIGEQKKSYILFSRGRLGTNEYSLGIPVKFSDINNANVLIEAPLNGIEFLSSQGTHFESSTYSSDMISASIPDKKLDPIKTIKSKATENNIKLEKVYETDEVVMFESKFQFASDERSNQLLIWF